MKSFTFPLNPKYIPFILGEETRPKIESFDKNKEHSIDITHSIFYNQYCSALSIVAELVSYNEEFKNASQHKTRNNIIIFTGDRGSGKTSCMMTVKELLCNTEHKKELYHKLDNLSDSARNLLINTTFHELETIGPMFFDSNHNILELFIGNLYIKFKEKEWERQQSYHTYHRNSTLSDKEKLLNRFSEAKRNLSLLYKKDSISEYDNLEELKDLAASMNLRTSLCELVQEYIKYMYGEEHQLVLDIDDIDLNMTNAYKTIEQIRKYLKIPGLIILMSVKLDQLANVIRTKYTSEYDSLITFDKYRYKEIINQICEKYLTKIFPLPQRIQLPIIHDILNQNINIKEITDNKGNQIIYNEEIKTYILKLIYQKTRLIFYNSLRQTSYIIPNNLRELLNFIHKLYQLPDAHNHEDALPNLFHFKEYFDMMWCTNNLSSNDKYFFENDLNKTTPLYTNKIVITYLKKRFPILLKQVQETDNQRSDIRELSYILEKDNLVFNISLGDVMACLNWLEKVCDEDKDLKLIFAIKVFYTINLYINYKNRNVLNNIKNNIKKAESIYRQTLTNNETTYLDLINGNFFNTEYLLPKEKEEDKYIQPSIRRNINFQFIKELWKYGEGIIPDLTKISTSIYSKMYKEPFVDRNLAKLIAEFFILSTSVDIDSKYISSYRKRNQVYYEGKIHPNRKYVVFDVLSIFYNLIDISKTYSRYGISKENNPIELEIISTYLKKDIPVSRLYKKYITKEDLINIASDTLCIRQVEFIEQISYQLQKIKSNQTDIIKYLKDIYKYLSQIKIASYDTNIHTLNFFQYYDSLLEEISQNKYANEIFKEILFENNK